MTEDATNREIMTGVDGINKRLDILNGSVAKNKDKLATHDIINAQVTMSQQQIINELANFRTAEEVNSSYRLRSQGSIEIIKWLIGVIGFANLVTLLKAFDIIR